MCAAASRSVQHRRLVLAAWLPALLAITYVFRAAGSRLADSWSLPGTDSGTATSLLVPVSPVISSDTEQVLVSAPGELTVKDPVVRARSTGLLRRPSSRAASPASSPRTARLDGPARPLQLVVLEGNAHRE